MDMKKALRLLKNLFKSKRYNKKAASLVRAFRRYSCLNARTSEAAELIRKKHKSQCLQLVIYN